MDASGTAGSTGSAGGTFGAASASSAANAPAGASAQPVPASAGATPVASPVSAPTTGTGTPVAPASDAATLAEYRTPRSALSEIQRAYLEGRPFGIAADEDPATAVPGDQPGDAIKSATVKAELQTPVSATDSRASAADTRLPARPGTAGTPQ